MNRLKNIPWIALGAALAASAARPSFAAPFDFEGLMAESAATLIRDREGHHGGSHPHHPNSPTPRRDRVAPAIPDRGRRERWEHREHRGGERRWEGGRGGRFNHSHWRFQHDQRRRGNWSVWGGWGALWVAGAGLGSCSAYYNYRLDECYSSCLGNARACRADFSGASECAENYSYCVNSCQIGFSSLLWSGCRVWVQPVVPLLDEGLLGEFPQPPASYQGGPYEPGLLAPPDLE